jgi:protein ImuB
MLWIALSLPELPLQAVEAGRTDCTAVVEGKGARRQLVACTADCADLGIAPGMDATTALVLAPALRLVERSPRREREALKALAAWAGQFSGFVSFDAQRLLLWLEAGSSLRLFGGLEALQERIVAGLAALGYAARLGAAPTAEAAALLARLGVQHPILKVDELKERLSPLPLAALHLDPACIEALRESGVRRIGELLALPRAGLARRFGPELVDALRRLTGELPDPRRPQAPPRSYRRRFELLGAVESTEALLFPLRRLLGEFQGYLQARDDAVQELRLLLVHSEGEPSVLELRTTTPLRDAGQLYVLARERLQRCEVAAPVEELVLAADRFVPYGDTQMELLDGGRQRDAAWNDLLDKLRARLGHDAVRQLGLRDDHRPEHAWCMVDEGEPAKLAYGPDLPERPLWLLEPRPLPSLPPLRGRPERIEAGWWDGADMARDYYTAESADGARLWLYRDAGSAQWFLHGLWA